MNDYPAIPADVNEAVLVIPCLANTLPGKAPENWELPLRFVPAPEGLCCPAGGGDHPDTNP